MLSFTYTMITSVDLDVTEYLMLKIWVSAIVLQTTVEHVKGTEQTEISTFSVRNLRFFFFFFFNGLLLSHTHSIF